MFKYILNCQLNKLLCTYYIITQCCLIVIIHSGASNAVVNITIIIMY